ncbi:MAG: cupredoxin domain-containing protein [Actinomycetota bacterium]
MSDRPVRDRFLLPILLPLGLLVVLALVMVGFAQILLSVTHSAATLVALVVAAAVVVVAAVAASRPQVRASTVASMVGAVAGVAMLAGGAALLLAAKGAEEGPEGPAVTVVLAAKDIAFTTDALRVPADAPFAIEFDNQDPGIQHNVEIFEAEDFSGEPLFQGELVTGPAQITYEVPALAAATYYFNCLVHPTMVGTIEAAAGAGEAVEGPTVVAMGLAFDTDVIELAAETATIVRMDNQDAGVPHNISVYTDETLSEQLYKAELVTGPAIAEYVIPPLPAGTYYFHCDVHPTMAGEVRVT